MEAIICWDFFLHVLTGYWYCITQVGKFYRQNQLIFLPLWQCHPLCIFVYVGVVSTTQGVWFPKLNMYTFMYNFVFKH